MLEGTFFENTTVEFPGGATQSATVSGVHRASVVVPDGADEGELFVTTSNDTTRATLGPLAFRLLPFGPDLQEFKQGPSLTEVRKNPSAVVVGKYLYVVGGFKSGAIHDTIERAEISGGTLGTFEKVLQLDDARWRHSAVSAGSEYYVLGGDPEPTGQLGLVGVLSVERARVFTDGALDAFQAVGTLHHDHGGAVSEVIGDRLYVLAGSTLDVEYASLRDGVASSFEIVPGLQVSTPDANQRRFAAGAVIDDSLCLFSGNPSIGPARIVCAQIAPDGSLGTFEPPMLGISPDPGDPLDKLIPNSGSLVVGRHLYLFGGIGGSPSTVSNAVFRIPFDGADRFKPIPQPPLITPREAAAVAVVGNSICVIGGEGGEGAIGALDTVECAAFAPRE